MRIIRLFVFTSSLRNTLKVKITGHLLWVTTMSQVIRWKRPRRLLHTSVRDSLWEYLVISCSHQKAKERILLLCKQWSYINSYLRRKGPKSKWESTRFLHNRCRWTSCVTVKDQYQWIVIIVLPWWRRTLQVLARFSRSTRSRLSDRSHKTIQKVHRSQQVIPLVGRSISHQWRVPWWSRLLSTSTRIIHRSTRCIKGWRIIKVATVKHRFQRPCSRTLERSRQQRRRLQPSSRILDSEMNEES